MSMHLEQRFHLKQMWCDHGLPFTDHCNLEFKVFSWGEVISVSLQRNNSSLQTVIADLGFHSPFSYTGVQCFWSHPTRDMLNLRHSSAMSSRFFLPVKDAFLLSVESSIWKCLCPVCYNHTWFSSSMWASILTGIGLWPVCMDITASFSVLFFFSYFLSLSLSLRPLTPDDGWTR